MSMQYIRDTYGVPVKRGMVVRELRPEHVRPRAKEMIVTYASGYVHTRTLWGNPRYRGRHHPTELQYLVDGRWWTPGDPLP